MIELIDIHELQLKSPTMVVGRHN